MNAMTALGSMPKWLPRLVGPGVVLAVAALALAYGSQLRHLAVPVLAEPAAAPSARPASLEELSLALEPLVPAGARVAALAESERGVLAIGLFDRGVALWRRGEAKPTPVPEIDGRRRFVTGLGWRKERLFVGTYGGVLEVDSSGRLCGIQLDGTAVESLLVTPERILAGTSRGLFARTDGLFEELPLVTPDGEPLRAISLASSRGTLWIGTSRGVYSVAAGERTAVWHPLVFGRPPATTNVALALAIAKEGAIAGTDDGGLARVGQDDVEALRFEDARANGVNPGAATQVAGCAVFGTRGGVVIGSPELESARRFAAALDVTAVHAGSRLFVGTASGQVLALDFDRLRCPERTAAR